MYDGSVRYYVFFAMYRYVPENAGCRSHNPRFVYECAAANVSAGNLDRYLYSNNEFYLKSDLFENNSGLQSPCCTDYRLKPHVNGV